MKIIILKEIEKLGKAGEVKMVSDGYARNFLIPRKMVEPATAKALKNLERAQAEIAARLLREKTAFEALAKKLRAIELRFTLKIGEIGQPFGSITAQDIVEKLAQNGINIEKNWIELEQPIKTPGEHTMKIRLPHQIESTVKAIIGAENPPKQVKRVK